METLRVEILQYFKAIYHWYGNLPVCIYVFPFILGNFNSLTNENFKNKHFEINFLNNIFESHKNSHSVKGSVKTNI